MTCLVETCDRSARSCGLCHRHSENLRRYGRAIPLRDIPLLTRICLIGWDVTDTGCWVYRGKKNDSGYGVYNDQRVHRVMYSEMVGPIPDGKLLRHTCDNPPCLNPDHLIPGTDKDNSDDKLSRKGHWTALRPTCRVGLHPKLGPGDCRECTRDRQRRYKKKVS